MSDNLSKELKELRRAILEAFQIAVTSTSELHDLNPFPLSDDRSVLPGFVNAQYENLLRLTNYDYDNKFMQDVIIDGKRPKPQIKEDFLNGYLKDLERLDRAAISSIGDAFSRTASQLKNSSKRILAESQKDRPSFEVLETDYLIAKETSERIVNAFWPYWLRENRP